MKVEVDGVKIIPVIGLGTWIAFKPAPGSAMITGHIIMKGTDLKAVQREAIDLGKTLVLVIVQNVPINFVLGKVAVISGLPV